MNIFAQPETQAAYKLFHEGALTLAEMEHNGIRIDLDYLRKAFKKVEKQITALEQDIEQEETYHIWKKRFGKKTNLRSATQLGEVVFKELKHEAKVFTRTGKVATKESVFEDIKLPFVQKVVKLKRLRNKVINTYLKGIERETVDGFLHPSFNLNLVDTFRSSCNDPNLQNFPIRDPEMGPLIRGCVVPREGWYLVEVDYGALEFKVAADFWQDDGMIEYASDETRDVHRDQTMEIYMLAKEQVSKDARYCGKNRFVFPTLYGSYYLPCAQNLWEAIDKMSLKTNDGVSLKKWLKSKGITKLGACNRKLPPRRGTFEHHIKGVEERFNSKFPSFGEGKERWWRKYLKRGWFRLMTGFICQGYYSFNNLLNTPIQGPGFHCLLWSATDINKELKKRKMKSLVVGEIHDCILGDVPPNELQDFLNLCKEIMTVRIRKHWAWMIVPMIVEADVVEPGSNWADKKPWIEKGGKWLPKAA